MKNVNKVALGIEHHESGNFQDQAQRTPKRKRVSSHSLALLKLSKDQKEHQITTFKKEVEGLFVYFNELMRGQRIEVGLGSDITHRDCGNFNGIVALLLEESDLPLSKLVQKIYDKLVTEKALSLTVAVVKTAVLAVGQRMTYGIPNMDADVLEDDSNECLWCWEARDIKLIPKSMRVTIKVRRTCRKNIHERINAVSSMIYALQKSDRDPTYETDIVTASDKINKVLDMENIRLLADNLLQKEKDIGDDKINQAQRPLIRQLEKNRREIEREERILKVELQKERQQAEKEQKRLQDKAERDERRREKEDHEMSRHKRKQLEESEREQRRREKEESHMKKQLSIQKQASIMERFLRKRVTNQSLEGSKSTETNASSSLHNGDEFTQPVTISMDSTLSAPNEINFEEIRMFQLSSWHHSGLSIRRKPKQHWGIRQKPKADYFNNIKLTASKDVVPVDFHSLDEQLPNNDSGYSMKEAENFPRLTNTLNKKQLLQFDKSYRPAFYGIWPKKSLIVGPRHPFKKEPDLDYDVDSDDEWEEDEPGESLSDCEEDDDEKLEDDCLRQDDEYDIAGEFLVPDGYLSENEGVEVDRMETILTEDALKISPSSRKDVESQEFCELIGQQKHLNNLVEHALRRNQPLIISNLLHDKAQFSVEDNLRNASNLEKSCLQALRIRPFSGGSIVEFSCNSNAAEKDTCLLNSSTGTSSVSTVANLQGVEVPVASSSFTNKVEFSASSMTQLKNEVCEMDNQWQVKKEILNKAGMSTSADKSPNRTQSISSFFTKRCMPPVTCTSASGGACSQPSLKPDSLL